LVQESICESFGIDIDVWVCCWSHQAILVFLQDDVDLVFTSFRAKPEEALVVGIHVKQEERSFVVELSEIPEFSEQSVVISDHLQGVLSRHRIPGVFLLNLMEPLKPTVIRLLVQLLFIVDSILRSIWSHEASHLAILVVVSNCSLPCWEVSAHRVWITDCEGFDEATFEDGGHLAEVLRHVVEPVADGAILVVAFWVAGDGGEEGVGYLVGLDLIDAVLLWKSVNGELLGELLILRRIVVNVVIG
jgi:hypothetical protein